MCQFMSAIVTKNEILWDIDIDSHEDLVEKFKLKDDSSFPEFVRIECVPIDGNIFNHDLGNWKTKVDQDFKPDWFDLKESDKKIKKLLVECFEKRFIKTDMEITNGRWFVNGSSKVVARDSSTVVAWDSSKVEARGSSKVEARDSSKIMKIENYAVAIDRRTNEIIFDKDKYKVKDSKEMGK